MMSMNPIKPHPVFTGVYKKDPHNPAAEKFVAMGNFSDEKEVRENNLGIPLWALDDEKGDHASQLRRVYRRSAYTSAQGRADAFNGPAHTDVVQKKRELARLAVD